MAFIVEVGSGTRGANSYAEVAFVTAYLTDRARQTENSWSTSTTAVQQAACVKATAYIDNRFGGLFKGVKRMTRIIGRIADGTLTLGSVPLEGEQVVLGAKTYTFTATLTNENDVLVGADVTESAANLAAAVSGSGQDTTTHEDTIANYDAGASSALGVVSVAAYVAGVSGNSVAFTTNVTGATVTGSGFLAGGLDDNPQPLEFPRSGLTDRDGNLVYGVPESVKQALSEYAVRSLAATLDPDLTVDATGATVRGSRKKLGDLETETAYAAGGAIYLFKPYPAADRLLAPFLRPSGVIR